MHKKIMHSNAALRKTLKLIGSRVILFLPFSEEKFASNAECPSQDSQKCTEDTAEQPLRIEIDDLSAALEESKLRTATAIGAPQVCPVEMTLILFHVQRHSARGSTFIKSIETSSLKLEL